MPPGEPPQLPHRPREQGARIIVGQNPRHGHVGFLPDIAGFWCQGCGMGADDADVAVLAGKFAEMRRHLDERAWRRYLGSEARARAELEGCGLAAAVAVVAAAAGTSRTTVTAGAGELAAGAEPMPGRRR